MLLLAVDPGSTSGVVVLYAAKDRETLVDHHAEVPFDKSAAMLQHRVEMVDAIVVERFTIGPRTLTYSRQPEALYVIGGLMLFAQLADKPLALQAPADAKAAFPDELLASMGLFTAVKGGHARDALRHGLLYLRRHPPPLDSASGVV